MSTTTENREKLKVVLKCPVAFDAVGDIKITTTIELSKVIRLLWLLPEGPVPA